MECHNLFFKLFSSLVLISIFARDVSALYRDDFPNIYAEPESTYDFIVVGGGVAGCAVAGRLSENGKHSVLVLEAGSMPDPQLDIPALSAYLITKSNYTTVHEAPTANAGLRAGHVRYIRGHTLGGGSQVNYQIFNRGSPFDFDNWANITGDPSWAYNSMLKYFRRSEDYLGIFPSNTQHGRGGPISVEKPKYAPGVDEFIRAGRELGYDIADPNGPQRVSFTPIEFARRNGRRVSSFTGYIKPYLNVRKNLKVIVNAEAQEIEFDGNRAVGVWFTEGGSSALHFVKCRNEVIVSSGVIRSPTLLQRSGIGPRNVLAAAGIPLRKELPVGENLQDHAYVKLEFIINNKLIVFDAERDLTPPNRRLYDLTGEGPFSSTHGFDGQAFIASANQQNTGNPHWPDIQIQYLSNIRIPNTFNPVFPNPVLKKWEAVVSCVFLGGRPKSRGYVRVNPHDIAGEPIVDLKFFSDPEGYDLEVAVDGIKRILEIFEKTSVYKILGARIPDTPMPECKGFEFRSDEYWRCYARQVTESGFQGSSTCAMGRGPDDRNAVVDSQLRVIGMEGLRVVDSSIMPEDANANLHAAVYGIAEKASDMILQQWEQPNYLGSS